MKEADIERILERVYPLHAAGWQRYWFYVPGIFFMLHFGKNVPEGVRQESAHGKKKISSSTLIWSQESS
jgi:hypothetical protein